MTSCDASGSHRKTSSHFARPHAHVLGGPSYDQRYSSMSEGANTPDVIAVAVKAAVDILAPGVGTLLCFVAHKALEKDDQELFRGHLQTAMTVDVHREDTPAWALFARYGNHRRIKKARRQAKGLVATLGPLDQLQRGGHLAQRPLDDRSHQVTPQAPDWDAPIPYLMRVAKRELLEAIDRSDVTTWTAHLSNGLVEHAADCLQDESDKSPATVWACIVTGNATATPAEGKAADLVSWAQAVALRFEVGLARDSRMKEWVARLDKHDRDAAQVETLRATQGIRTALAAIAFAVLLVLPIEFVLERAL